jgi:hypothetical protein
VSNAAKYGELAALRPLLSFSNPGNEVETFINTFYRPGGAGTPFGPCSGLLLSQTLKTDLGSLIEN